MMNKSLVDELLEDSELDQKIVKSFYSKDTLSSDIFEDTDGSYKMHKGIRDKLLEISDAFIDFIGVDFFIEDVHLTGSLSNYNWSEYSDVDLHILTNFEDFDNQKIIKEFFVKGYDVELYVQDSNESHLSSGVYSLLNDKWIVEPKIGKQHIDEDLILKKGEEYAKIIEDLVKKSEQGKDVSNDVDDVKSKIKQFRQSGLESGGEYSYENLTFKLLRRNGYIQKLLDIKKGITNKKLSVSES